MPQQGRNLELGADPIGTGHEHRIPVPGKAEQSRETASGVNDLGPVGHGGKGLDPLLEPLHFIEVNAGGQVRCCRTREAPEGEGWGR